MLWAASANHNGLPMTVLSIALKLSLLNRKKQGRGDGGENSAWLKKTGVGGLNKNVWGTVWKGATKKIIKETI